MAMRTFLGSDGQQWVAWLARSGAAGAWLGAPGEWLVFQNGDDTERRRLMEIPANWEMLPENRLDLLRRMATPVVLYAHRHSPATGIDRAKVVPPDDE
jgi:hypothetical protein